MRCGRNRGDIIRLFQAPLTFQAASVDRLHSCGGRRTSKGDDVLRVRRLEYRFLGNSYSHASVPNSGAAPSVIREPAADAAADAFLYSAATQVCPNISNAMVVL